jgi:LacI family transcriptional regulator
VEQHHYVVGTTDRVERRPYPGVFSDNVLGTRLVLDHFWNLGHRSIACVSDPRNRDGRHRVEIYQQYMREHGIPEKTHIYMTSQDPQECYQVAQEFFASLTGSDRPTAIYAASDTIAIYFMQAAFQAGVAVPEQISIVGYDNIDMAAFTIPPLTTINQGGVKMGEVTANLLLDMIEDEQDASEISDVMLSPTLVLRQSTTVPPTR